MSESLENLEDELICELESDKYAILTDPYGDERITEYVDSAVPVYNGDRADVLASSAGLSSYGAEFSTGEEDIYTRIGYAIYEYLSQVAHSWKSTAEFLPEDCELIDDGTMDTVISVCGNEIRYDVETAVHYRDEDCGELDLDRFIEDVVLPGLL
jgi:hypothetical protein